MFDLPGRAAVARYLNGKKGFLLVSHDRVFLDACVDHILAINKTEIAVTAGNFNIWWEQRQRQETFAQAQNKRLQGDIARFRQSARRAADWSNRTERGKHEAQASGLAVDTGYVGHKSAKMMQRAKNVQHRQEAAIAEKSQLLQDVEQAEELKIHPLSFYSERLLELTQVSLFYGDREVCNDVAFTLRQGERLVLTGKNGSGKSTLLKFICGEAVRHTGMLQRPNQLVISYVPQDTAQLRGSLKDYIEAQCVDESLCKAILRKLDVSREQFELDMSGYSAGQKKKVLLARSLSQRAHLYIWDEPLNYIDVLSRMQIESLLQAYRPTMLFVEHDAAFCGTIATGQVALAALERREIP